MKRTWIITGLLIVFAAAAILMAQPSGGGPGGGMGGGPGYGEGTGGGRPDGGRFPFMDDLTEEQQEAIRALINEMREDGASREEIREAVHEQLEDWGIELPEPGAGRGERLPFWDDLTEEQQAELEAMIDEMREDGATREDIREAVHAQLEEWGIDAPEPGEGGGRRPPFWGELSEEQRAELREMIDEMREDGATREDIREAVHAQLEEWGIELPEPGEGRRTPPFWDDLTEEQQEALREMIDEMREDGATREDIREAVHAQLEEWGIEVPVGPGGAGGGFGGRPGGDGSEFAPSDRSERTQLRQQIKTSVTPSPAKASAEVEYTLEEPSYTIINVFDANGRLIKNVYSGSQDQGSHSIMWDGKDADGNKLNSGVYFVRIQSGNMIGSQRIVLAK